MIEEIEVAGERAADTVKKIIKEGNVRRVIIKDKAGETVLSVPLTVGVVGVALAPILAAVGAVASIMTECTIRVERDEASPNQS